MALNSGASGTVTTMEEGGDHHGHPGRLSTAYPAQPFLLNVGSAITMENQPAVRLGDGHQLKLPPDFAGSRAYRACSATRQYFRGADPTFSDITNDLARRVGSAEEDLMAISRDDVRLSTLERKMTWLSVACWLQLVVVCGLCLALTRQRRVEAAEGSPVLRAKGLIIEDSHGRARVLLGSPLPSPPERARQDASTTSMVFLDEQGHDRLTLGEEPEPQVAGKVSRSMHRIAPGYGVVIHDGGGDERGTYGWLANGRALITLDRPGLDAWAAVVDDKTGFAGIRVEYPPDIARDSNAIEIGTRGSQAFVKLKDTKEKDRAVFSMDGEGRTEFKTLDKTGVTIRQMALSTVER
jgi:hypothetical protein